MPVDEAAAFGFFQLIAARYEYRPTILTTNQPFSKWPDVFGDTVIANAIIDRLVHHCDIVKITGHSYRIMGRNSGEEISLEAVDDIRNHQMHSSAEEILSSLDGIISPLQRKLIRSVLDHIDDMTKRIKDIDKIIKDYIKDYEDAINALEEIPVVGKIGAQTIISEIGKDMSRFPSASHLCSWAGVAPGNNESAGKRRSGRTTKGNPTLKTETSFYLV